MSQGPNEPAGGAGHPQGVAPGQPVTHAPWSAPAGPGPTASAEPSRGGSRPSPAPAGPWSAPPAPANRMAAWQQRPTGPGAFAYFFATPPGLEGGLRMLYVALTLASLPILLPAVVMFFGLRSRIRRRGVTTHLAITTQLVGTAVVFFGFMVVGEGLGLDGHLFALPFTFLLLLPVGARYLLRRLAG